MGVEGVPEIDDLVITSLCVAGNKAIEDAVRSWISGEGEPASIVITELARDRSGKKSFVYEDCVPMSYVPPHADTDPSEGSIGLHQLSLSPGRLQVSGPDPQAGRPQTDELIHVYVKRFRLELSGIEIPGVTKVIPGTVEWDPETGEHSFGNWLIEIIRSPDPILEQLRRYSAKAAEGDAGPETFSLYSFGRTGSTVLFSIHALATPVHQTGQDSDNTSKVKKDRYHLEIEHMSFGEPAW